MDLNGASAIITGGASGIGLGTVELFVAEGAKVVAADIQDEKGAMLEKRFPGQVVYAHCDVTSEAEIEAALQKAKTEFGGLDILFNNAGISDRMTSIVEITADGWSWIFDILVRGPALGMKHAVPLMLERGGGSIVNTASIGGLLATPTAVAYITSKGAIVMMTKTAALEYAQKNIRVNAIGPGITRTPWLDKLDAALIDTLAAQVPQGRLGEPAEMANVAAFLASDEASHVSGQLWVIDGARSAG